MCIFKLCSVFTPHWTIRHGRGQNVAGARTNGGPGRGPGANGRRRGGDSTEPAAVRGASADPGSSCAAQRGTG